MNVNSIVSDKKRSLARIDIAKTGADIVILTETRLGENDSEFIVPGYYLIHHEVRKENAGGVMALAKDEIHAHSESGVSLGIKKEIQVVQFVVNDITFFGVYRSPTAKNIGPLIDHHRALRNHLNKEIDKLEDYPFVITGDMNMWELAECDFDPDLKPISDDQVETIDHIWAEFVKIHDLEQHVTDITYRRSAHILDYVFTQKNTGILLLEVGAFDSTFDHYPVVFQIESEYLTDETPKMRRKNSPDTLQAFFDDLKSKLWDRGDLINFPTNSSNRASDYLNDIMWSSYIKTNPESLVKPPSANGYLQKVTLRSLNCAKRLAKKDPPTQSHE
jgi:exonuclease III